MVYSEGYEHRESWEVISRSTIFFCQKEKTVLAIRRQTFYFTFIYLFILLLVFIVIFESMTKHHKDGKISSSRMRKSGTFSYGAQLQKGFYVCTTRGRKYAENLQSLRKIKSDATAKTLCI